MPRTKTMSEARQVFKVVTEEDLRCARRLLVGDEGSPAERIRRMLAEIKRDSKGSA